MWLQSTTYILNLYYDGKLGLQLFFIAKLKININIVGGRLFHYGEENIKIDVRCKMGWNTISTYWNPGVGGSLAVTIVIFF